MTDLLNMRESAKLIGVDPVTVWRWRKAGLIETVWVEHQPFLRKSDLQKFKPPLRGRPRSKQ
jgi:predicted site-specific integrase-resolvase